MYLCSNMVLVDILLLYTLFGCVAGQTDDYSCNDVTLTDEKGFIRSPIPGIDVAYDDDIDCRWTIIAENDKVIELEIQSLYMPSSTYFSTTCGYELHVIDGNHRRFGFCGFNPPPPLTSKAQWMNIIFHDSIAADVGFNATYKHIDGQVCSEFETIRNGQLQSPDTNSDGFYENNMDCTWVIWSNDIEYLVVQIYVTSLDIPSRGDCKDDYLEVYDGPVRLTVNCGSDLPPLITTTFHYAMVKFYSNRRVRGRGFSGIYKIVDQDRSCNGIYTAEAGEITFDNYYDYGYKVCEWVIMIPDHHRAELKILGMDFPAGEDLCKLNYVQIHDGVGLLETLCDNQIPPLITTSSKHLKLNLETTYLFRTFGHKGLSAVYLLKDQRLSCGGIRTSQDGEIVFSGTELTIDDNFSSVILCIWVIAVANQEVTELQFTNINIDSEENCSDNSIQIFRDTYNETTSPKDKVCGTELPLKTTARIIYLQLLAGSPNITIEFRTKYKFFIGKKICGEVLNATLGSQGTLSHVIDASDLSFDGHCRWHIQASVNHTVELKILKLVIPDIGNNTECKHYLEVYDGSSEKAMMIGKYCSKRPPDVIASSARDMFVHFQSHSQTSGEGFEAVYTQSAGIQTRCGRTLSKTSGVLQSPDFDQDGYYDHNLECDWTIVTEPGLIVLLLTQAESFDIEAGFCKYSAIYYSGRLRCSPTVDSECRYDNVKVNDGYDHESDLIGTYCGHKMPSKIRSTGNVMHVRFTSDGTINSVGFVIEYSCVTAEALRQWPDGNYSIPMSIYGCPDQAINKWKHGSINMTFTYPITFNEPTYRPIGETDQKTGRLQDFYALGPFGKFSYQLNFCTKFGSHHGSITPNKAAEWPFGNYGVFAMSSECPKGLTDFLITLPVGEMRYTRHGWAPDLICKYDETLQSGCSYNMAICLKAEKNNFDVASIGDVFRPPFTVLSPHIAFMNIREEMAQDGFNELLDWLRGVDKTSMITNNASMRVVEETFTISSPYEYLDIAYKFKKVEQWFSFWTLMPIEIERLYLEKKGNETHVVSSWALGIGTMWHHMSDGQPIWMSYDLSQAVHITGLRFVPNDDTILGDGDEITFNSVSILLSRMKWNFLYHGAWHCLKYRNESDDSLYCLNDDDYLSVRYVTIQDVSGTLLEKLLTRTWSVWLISDRDSMSCQQSLGMEDGYIEDFQITSSSELFKHPRSSGRLGRDGWCAGETDMKPYIQMDLLHPMEIEGVIICRSQRLTYEAKIELSFSHSSNYSEWITLRNELSDHPEIWVYEPSASDTSESAYYFNAHILARYFKIELELLRYGDAIPYADICLSFELIGCRHSGLKNIQCGDSGKTEIMQSKNVFFNYLNASPNNRVLSRDWLERLSECRQNRSQCSIIPIDAHCEMHDLSPSQSYGISKETGESKTTFINLFPSVTLHRSSLYLTGNQTWDDVTTIIYHPGMITSVDFPFRYSSGELWSWEIYFNNSISVHLILYNISFNLYQVHQQSDSHMRFSDNLDRLYITRPSFYSDLILSDELVDKSEDIILAADKTIEEGVPHLISYSDKVKIYWRTTVQSNQQNSAAAGFRILTYPSSDRICLSSTHCAFTEAAVFSKSLLGDTPTTTEIWYLIPSAKKYILLNFETFDIGCQTGNILEIETTTTGKRAICNKNKAEMLSGLKADGLSMKITFKFERRVSYLIEGFGARYVQLECKNFESELVSEEASESVELITMQHVPALKVCSEYFNKCYILIDLIHHVFDTLLPSWSFVDSVCELHKWNMISLHSKRENDFVGRYVQNKFNVTEKPYLYIGFRRIFAKHATYRWNDDSPVTFMSWTKDHPSPSLDEYCTRMSLRLSEDNNWESTNCGTVNSAVAACQYQNKAVDNQERNGTDVRIPTNTSALLHPAIWMNTSVFHCRNQEVISLLGRCDNRFDCFDSSDEENCPDTTDACTVFQFRCNDKSCVSISILCDHTPDCSEAEDESCYFPSCTDCADQMTTLEETNNCKENEFLCTSTDCIPNAFVCDGIADCVSGRDEQDCQLPDSCQAWWDAGYHDSGVYSIHGSYTECNFGPVRANKSIVTKFRNIDHDRFVSDAHIGVFTYTNEETLFSILDSNVCYQDVDQLCQPWVQKLYEIDRQHTDLNNTGTIFHACQCVRYRTVMTYNRMYSSSVEDCDGSGSIPDHAFHFEIKHGATNGILETMRLKPGHVFDVGQLKIVVHPIVCHADMTMRRVGIACGNGITTLADARCLFREDTVRHIIGCRTLEHLQSCESFECPEYFFKCPDSFCVERRFVCDGIVHCENGDDELDCNKYVCAFEYRCLNSTICLPRHNVCDGFPHCPHGDDERLCNFTCPDGCTCLGFTVTCSEFMEEPVNHNLIFPNTTRMLDISGNQEAFHHISFNDKYVQYIVHLNLSSCAINTISATTLKFMKNLIILDLSMNHLKYLPGRLFTSQTKLQILKIEDNLELLYIEEEAFFGLDSITFLSLSNLKLDYVSKRAFASLRLDILDISGSYIHHCEDNAFEALNVKNLFLNDTDIVEFSTGLFEGVVLTEKLVTKAYKFCCVKPYYLNEESCFPRRDEFSSCDDLVRNDIIRPLLWITGLLGLLGNTLAFIYRLYDTKRMKIGYGIFVANLAVSDFLMGIYLIIIASADMYYRGSYIFNDDYWRHGWLCQVAGVLATLSSEASVVFIGLITLDRLLVIKYPFGNYRMTQKPSWIFVSATWFFGLFVSIFPVIFPPFGGEFYSKSGVCLALPLTKDRPTGWLYSFIIFVAFNLFFVLLVAFGQWSIFSEVISSSKKSLGKSKLNRKKELRVARNLLLVAFTDFICWFPIGMLGIAAFNGTTFSGDVYAWVSVFILPVNSALNPFLYTLAALFKNEGHYCVTLDSRPELAIKSTMKAENIKQLGDIVRVILDAKEKALTKSNSPQQ